MKTLTVLILICFTVTIMSSCAPAQGTGGRNTMSSTGIGGIFNFELNLSQAQKSQVMTLVTGIYLSNQSDINNFLKYAQPLVQAITAKKYKKSRIEKAYNVYMPYEKKMMVLLGYFYVEFYKILDANQKKIMDDNIAKLMQILQDPFSLLNLLTSLQTEIQQR